VAVVAAPRARRDVQGERDVAVRAARHEAAGATLRVVRVPAAVEEEECLLAALQSRGERRTQWRRQQPRRALAAQVDDPDDRERAAVDAVRQGETDVLAARGVGERLEA